MIKDFLFVAGFIILGVLSIGKGITGLVVSESCCFPPDCDADNLCESAAETFSTPWGSYFFLIFGSFCIVAAVFSFLSQKKQDRY